MFYININVMCILLLILVVSINATLRLLLALYINDYIKKNIEIYYTFKKLLQGYIVFHNFEIDKICLS